MINAQLKFKIKVPNDSKVVAFTRKYIIFFKFQGQFDLEGQVKFTNVQTNRTHLDDQ